MLGQSSFEIRIVTDAVDGRTQDGKITLSPINNLSLAWGTSLLLLLLRAAAGQLNKLSPGYHILFVACVS